MMLDIVLMWNGDCPYNFIVGVFTKRKKNNNYYSDNTHTRYTCCNFLEIAIDFASQLNEKFEFEKAKKCKKFKARTFYFVKELMIMMKEMRIFYLQLTNNQKKNKKIPWHRLHCAWFFIICKLCLKSILNGLSVHLPFAHYAV